MKFGEMKRNTSNWSNFCMLLRRAGLTASAGLSCYNNSLKQDLGLCNIAVIAFSLHMCEWGLRWT